MTGPRVRDLVVAALGGLVAFLLLQPASGQDSLPPTCWNSFGGEVDCDASAWPLVVAVAVILLLVMWLVSLRQARRIRSSG